ncbi:unnamed protein product, partial [Polarella glacialis]
LLVTVECAMHVPAAMEDRRLVVRVFFVADGERPSFTAKPVAQSYQYRASRVTLIESSKSRLNRLLMRNFGPDASGRRLGSDTGSDTGSEDEEDSCQQGFDRSSCPKARSSSSSGYYESDEARLKERLQHLWQNFRTADNRHLRDWAHEDQTSCVKTIADLLGVSEWEEARLTNLVEELANNEGTESTTWTRGVAAVPTRGSLGQRRPAPEPSKPKVLEKPVECHWKQQLRAFAPGPLSQEVPLAKQFSNFGQFQ